MLNYAGLHKEIICLCVKSRLLKSKRYREEKFMPNS